ncbi:type VI secretion system baseplate subunit TssK [Paraburkholderia bonniea]|uniref:type VI secretion system baseplate subunit TssK n=1 Tax=Paraburkholderia bonniea TaxID=2152891 RepID=UPI001580C341|nr:type VI secretion system baseplate subunit TssK [Paraburkholderia bonniea]WJF89266.1 type VI secretion system baseplate subunit TssK [Paraburkholderia bonniea]WJF92582.1 type VI secretion system baseplate subunit TssK [Paraburkholderia bonniea]
MNFEQPLYWHQGQLLQPQHLQHADGFHASRLERLADLALPYCWGLEGLQINEAALAADQFMVSSLSARFQDGAFVRYPGNALLDARSLQRSSDAPWPRAVYLGLRRVAPGSANCSVHDSLDAAASAPTRFATLTDPETIPDYLSGGNSAQVRGMFYVLRLFWDDELEAAGQYELLPLARLELDGDSVRLEPGFMPLVASLGASVALMQVVRDIRDELLGRAHQLESNKIAADALNVSVDSGQLRVLMALNVLGRYGPLLCHLLETPQTHPWHVYGALRQLVGELSMFSARYDMLGRGKDDRVAVAPYRHEEAGMQIASIGALIARLLNEITFGPDQVVRFEQADDIWVADLPESFLSGHNRYYLIVSGLSEADAVARFAAEAKLGAASELANLVSHALPGLELLPLAVPPAGMPRRQQSAYFRIETVSDAWASVVRERGVALFHSAPTQTLSVEIVMIRR